MLKNESALADLLDVIMIHEFGHRAMQRRPPDEYHLIEAFFFDRANEALGVCIQIQKRRPPGALSQHVCP